MIEMTLKSGEVYTLDDEGYVVARSDGPKGWNYGREWRIVGFKKRHNAHHTVSLAEALAGAGVGQGWVCDWDHGTYRMWAHPSNRRLSNLKKAGA